MALSGEAPLPHVLPYMRCLIFALIRQGLWGVGGGGSTLDESALKRHVICAPNRQLSEPTNIVLAWFRLILQSVLRPVSLSQFPSGRFFHACLMMLCFLSGL